MAKFLRTKYPLSDSLLSAMDYLARNSQEPSEKACEEASKMFLLFPEERKQLCIWVKKRTWAPKKRTWTPKKELKVVQKTLYLVGLNRGDGTLSIQVYDDKRVAEWSESQETEGFAESTIKELKITSSNDGCEIKTDCTTLFGYYLDLVDYGSERQIKKFKNDFGSEFPEYELVEMEIEGRDGYKKVHVMVNGDSHHYFFVPSKTKLEDLRKRIDSGIERTY
jgi:hypothetical protein